MTQDLYVFLTRTREHARRVETSVRVFFLLFSNGVIHFELEMGRGWGREPLKPSLFSVSTNLHYLNERLTTILIV